MNQPTPSAALSSAAELFGQPGVITQYTNKGKVSRRLTVRRLGQLALNESMLFILEGEKIQGFVYLAEIRGLHVEPRRTYKHPIVGALIGLAMVIAPTAFIARDPQNLSKTFGGDFFLIWGPLLVIAGLYTFYEAALSKKVPWLIIKTATTERPFMLCEPLTQTQSDLLAALAAAIPPPT